MKTFQVYENQTLIDLAVQLYGDSTYIVKLCVDNGLTLDSILNGSMSVIYDETLTALNETAAQFSVTSTFVATYTGNDGLDLLEHSIQEHTVEEHN